MYLEGSDQHRGWFQASLLESCGTRGRAPFDVVLTHGFTLDEKGRKQSKSLGNQTFPQDVIKASGADILRLWVASTDYSDDQRIGPDILKMVSDNYRKLRNSLRWMLGMLTHYNRNRTLAFSMIEPLDRLMLHRLSELDQEVRKAYGEFDFARVVSALSAFLNTDLSAFYFDVRKDALYCEPASSLKRLGALETIERIFRAVTVWLAPILAFTAEEAWRARYPQARLRASRNVPGNPREFPRPRARREMGRFAQAALGRHRRAGARPRGQGYRLLAGGPSRCSISRTASGGRRLRASISPKSASSRISQSSKAPRRKAPSVTPTRRARRWWCSGPRASNARAPGAISIPRPPIPISPT